MRRSHLTRTLVLVPASVLGLALGACAASPPAEAPEPEAPVTTRHGEDLFCRSSSILLDAHFSGGELGECRPGDGGRFELVLHPEDPPPINVSPWYAFRVSGAAGDAVALTLSFPEGRARYWPKVSVDGKNWSRLPEARVRRSGGEDDEAQGAIAQMHLDLKLTGPALWVAGQPLLTDRYFEDWDQALDALPFATRKLRGASLEGRPIYATETPDRREYVLLVGRQHPPELTGTLTMRPFVDELMGDTDLAQAFRDRYKLVIYPVLNPDGVARGHWRHNEGGVDLNRDWGPFTQPETRLVRDHVDALEARGMRPRLMLDFHSTWRNLFYTQLPEDMTDPEAFAGRWLAAGRARLPDYAFTNEPTAVSERGTTKNYFYKRFGIPSITYETGDETDPPAIEASARVFAQEMMRLMLEAPPRG